MHRKRPAAASYLDALLLSSSVTLELPVRIEEHDASKGEPGGAKDRENSAPSVDGENVVAAFNALLTSLDAKLPTSRFTADELRISNGRGRRSRCELHSLPATLQRCNPATLSSSLLRRGRRGRRGRVHFEFRSCAGMGM